MVVVRKVALLAEALRVVNSVRVQAHPRLLLATFTMVAIDAHALRVVPPIRVLAVHNLSLIFLDSVVWAVDTAHGDLGNEVAQWLLHVLLQRHLAVIEWFTTDLSLVFC